MTQWWMLGLCAVQLSKLIFKKSKKSVDLFSFQFYVRFRSALNVIRWFIFVCKVCCFMNIFRFYVSFLLLIAMEMG